MKKTFFILMSIVFVMQIAWTPSLRAQEYVPEDQYDQNQSDGYAYDDNYANLDWRSMGRSPGYYSYYDSYNAFLVVIGHRVFVVPYDFFYNSIWPYCRHFRHHTWNHFASWWGIGFYNHIWDRYHWRHHSRNYRRGHNYYNDHRDYSRTRIRRNELRSHENRRTYGDRNRYDRKPTFSEKRYDRKPVYKDNRTYQNQQPSVQQRRYRPIERSRNNAPSMRKDSSFRGFGKVSSSRGSGPSRGSYTNRGSHSSFGGSRVVKRGHK